MTIPANSCALPILSEPAFTISMNTLSRCTKEELKEKIALIAGHINKGKDFATWATPAYPENHITALNRPGKALTIPVLNALTQVSSKALENGIDPEEEGMTVIASFCHKIIEAHPLSQDPISLLPSEIRPLLLKNLPFNHYAGLRRVSTLWYEPACKAQIDEINHHSLRLSLYLSPRFTASQTVDWLINSPSRSHLLYADFIGFSFNNGCLERLASHSPNIQHLLISSHQFKWDVLKHLERFIDLKNLEISDCRFLERDALKHLIHIPNLQKLNISFCYALEKDALKHLVHVPNLQKLNIAHCSRLEFDALKHLVHVPGLQELDITQCYLDRTKIPASLQGIEILG